MVAAVCLVDVNIYSSVIYFDYPQVVDVDDVHQKVTVKLVPRIDLQALTDKMVSYLFVASNPDS